MSKKMTKDIKYVVEQANEILKNPKSSIEFKTDVFAFIQHLLLDKKMYHGFNYYIYDMNLKCLKLAGQQTDLIQFYIH